MLRPPYQLKSLLLVSLSSLALCIVALNAVLSYERISHQTMEATLQRAKSIAGLVAKNNLENLIVNDLSSIESNLQQVIQLPDVHQLEVIRGDGKLLARVTTRQDSLELPGTSIGRLMPLPQNDSKNDGVSRSISEDLIEVWSPVELSGQAPLGWVRAEYSLAARHLELRRLWRNSLETILLTLGVILIALPLLLDRALHPIRQLSRIASNLSNQLGQSVEVNTQVQEAQVLAHALNKASVEVAQQVARTQIIVNTAAVGIISLDAQGRILSANPATISLFGREEAELIGVSLGDCVPGLHAELLLDLFKDYQPAQGRTLRVVRTDFHGLRLDGTQFPVELTLGQANDNVRLRYVCIVRDVTDERATQETTELYERALASSHNGVFITNAARDSQPIIFINQAFQNITGLQPHEVLGRSMELLRQGRPDEPALLELKQAVLEKRSTSVTLRDELMNGHRLTAEVSLSPVLAADGRLTNFVGIVSDVTARERAEQAIAERSAKLDAIFSLSPDGFVLFGSDGLLSFANPAFERMTGLDWRHEEVPMTRQEFELTLASLCHPDHAMPDIWIDAQHEESWTCRLTLGRPQHRVLQVTSRRNFAGQGETVLYFSDVTHEDEVDRMKSEFLASAAHELRTPMVSIFGFTELLLKREFSAERRTDMLQTIHRQSGLLVKMINELLDLARIEARGGLDLKIGPHELEGLVEDCVQGLMRSENDRQVVRGPIPAAAVMVDPEKMQLALNNLLSNAFKYSPQGGDVTLQGRLKQENGKCYALLEVQDHGIGMSPEQLTRAFERFYRADTTGNIPGTGLGLSLVKEIAELHAGRIELESVYGQGTLARLWIPCDNSASEQESAPIAVELSTEA